MHSPLPHGTRPRGSLSRVHTGNVRIARTRVNALPTTRATHRALIRPRLWPYSFAKCHACVGKIERTTGCQVVFAFPFFFSPLSVAPVTQSSPLPLQKIFFLENYIPILSFLADIFERDLPMRFKRRSVIAIRNESLVSFVPFEHGAHARFVRAPISKSIVIEKITVLNDTPNRNRRLFSVYKSYETHRPVRGSCLRP